VRSPVGDALDSGGSLWRRGVNWWIRLRGDATWRAYVLLWLWVSLPVLLQLRHGSPVYPHYLTTLYPGLFVVSGVGAAWLIERAAALGRALVRRETRGGRIWRAVPAVGAGMLVALLIAGQAAQSALFVSSMAGAQFDMAGGGFDNLPLRALEAANTTLTRLQRQQGAQVVYVLTQPSRDVSLTYMLVGERPDRVRVPNDCLVLPAPSAGAALVVSSQASSNSARLLASLPEATHLAALPLPGGEPLQVFRVAAPLVPSRGEQRSTPLIFRDAMGNGLELDGVSWAGRGVMRLRWTVLGSTPHGMFIPWFRVSADAGASGSSGTASTVDCQPTRWQAHETVYTWLAVPAAGNGPAAVASATARPGAVTIGVQEATSAPGIHTVGPLRVFSFDVLFTPLTNLPAVAGPNA
jgi:hypothetical protein